MVIQCERCGKEFKKMDNLRRHLNRVYICQPILNDISIESLRIKHACKKGIFKCEHCGKEYKTSSGKSKHKKKCVKPSDKDLIIESQTKQLLDNEDLLKDALTKINKAQEEREKLEQQVKNLLMQKQCVQNITNNNFIIINNFGEENTEYLQQDELFLKNCIESPIQSVQKYLDAVHFNKDHPENNNIKLTNLQSPFMDYFKNGNWNKVEQQVLIPRLINKSVKTIHKLIENKDDDNNGESSNWYEYRHKLSDNTVKQKIKSKAKSFIYNKTLNL
jgi:hypothetical protein